MREPEIQIPPLGAGFVFAAGPSPHTDRFRVHGRLTSSSDCAIPCAQMNRLLEHYFIKTNLLIFMNRTVPSSPLTVNRTKYTPLAVLLASHVAVWYPA